MNLSLLSYNLFFNKAINGLLTIIQNTKPDIITVQEINTSQNNLHILDSIGYKLADYSNSFYKFGTIYGIATYYNPSTISFIKSESVSLTRSIYEIFLAILQGGNKPRTLLSTHFRGIKNNKNFVVHNLHLSHIGTNSIRIKQIKKTLYTLQNEKLPCIVVGDFNYPYGRKEFETIFHKYDFEEASNSILFTFEKKILGFFKVSLKLDYVLYRKFLKATSNLLTNEHYSDHYPLLTRLHF